jgi:hypothetical protein
LAPTVVSSFAEAVEHGGRAMEHRRELLREAQYALRRWDATRDPGELVTLLQALEELAELLRA